MCGCEFNVAGAGGTIAGAVHDHSSSRSDISAIYHSALFGHPKWGNGGGDASTNIKNPKPKTVTIFMLDRALKVHQSYLCSKFSMCKCYFQFQLNQILWQIKVLFVIPKLYTLLNNYFPHLEIGKLSKKSQNVFHLFYG